MRGHAVTLVVAAVGLAAPAGAQSEQSAEAPRTAEQMIERAREVYTVRETQPDPCPEATNTEIVVCKAYAEDEGQRLAYPTERANAAGERPPDPIPAAPYVLGLPECGVEAVCHRFGRTPVAPLIIDLEAIPEALTPDEAARVLRAEDLPSDTSPGAASPAAVP